MNITHHLPTLAVSLVAAFTPIATFGQVRHLTDSELDMNYCDKGPNVFYFLEKVSVPTIVDCHRKFSYPLDCSDINFLVWIHRTGEADERHTGWTDMTVGEARQKVNDAQSKYCKAPATSWQFGPHALG